MSQIDALFRLVQGMNKNEKKYFKENASSSNLLYVQLFDAINELDHYDEVVFLAKNQKKDFVKNYAYNKNNLFEHLLKSLSVYKSKKDIQDISYEKLQFIKVLFDKGLYDLVDKQITKLKQYCNEYEIYERLEEVLSFEYHFLEKRFHSKDKIILELQELIKMKENGIELNKMYSKVLSIATEYDYSLHKSLQYLLDDILQDPLVKTENQIVSRTGRYTRFNILSLSAYITKRFADAFNYKFKAYKLYEKDKTFYEINSESYLNLIGNMIAIAYNIPDKENFKAAYDILIENHQLIKGLAQTKFEQYCSFSVMKCNLLEDYSDYDSVVKYYFEHRYLYEDKLSKTHEIDTLFNIAVGYFLDKKYDQSYSIIVELINHPIVGERFLVERYIKLLELFILVIQNENKVLEHRLIAFERYLKKNDASYMYYSICLKYLKELYHLEPNKKRTTIIKEWQLGLEEIPEDEYRSISNDMFDLKSWLARSSF